MSENQIVYNYYRLYELAKTINCVLQYKGVAFSIFVPPLDSFHNGKEIALYDTLAEIEAYLNGLKAAGIKDARDLLEATS